MKCATLLKTFMLLVLTASAMQPIYALNNISMPEVKISVIPAEKKLGVVISNTKQSQTVLIQDQRGVILMSESIGPEQNYAKLINLKKLPVDKRYFLIVDNDLQQQVYPFMLTERGAIMDDAKQKVLYKPVVNVKDGYIDLSYFNGKITNVEVTFYNQNGDEFFSESLDYVIKVEKRYKLKAFTAGQYTLEVSTPSKTYIHQFEVN